MSIPFILSILAALCLIPILIQGAMSDVNTRTFPSSLWKSKYHLVEIAGTLVLTQYICMAAMGDMITVVTLVLVSIFLSLIFLFAGLNFGSGGDWRALIFIVWVSPAFILATCLASLAFGFVLAIYAMIEPEDEIEPILYRTVPFAVAICCGYICAIGYAVLVNL